MKTARIATKCVAGMVDHSIEFFIANEKHFAMFKGKVYLIEELPDSILSSIETFMDESIQGYLDILGIEGRIPRIEKFLSCRYGGLDFNADYSDEKLGKAEYCHCPNRGNCPVEFQLCILPDGLTKLETSYLQMIANDHSEKMIADRLGLSPKTIEKLSHKLRAKLNVFTSKGLAVYAAQNNLV